MADIFISYSKQDQDDAYKLAALLEAEGYSVWWDTSLLSGESFRKVIMTELGRARAAIVIWTENSIHSDWVQSEAGRAHADRKLIPVKAKGLAYKDIPPPFDNMHIESLTERDKILGAVVAQLAKPEFYPSNFWMATRTLRLQLLTWAGIVGGSITLFTNLRGLIGLADWARWIIEHWREWTQAFWTTAFGWIGIHLNPILAPGVSFLSFLTLVLIGTILRAGTSSNLRQKAKRFAGAILIFCLYLVVLFIVRAWINASERSWLTDSVPIVATLFPYAALVWFAREKTQCTILMFFVFCFWVIMALIPDLDPSLYLIDDLNALEMYLYIAQSLALGPLGAIVVASFAPFPAINKRLLFLALGTLLLLALNHISALGIENWLSPPKSG